MGNQVSEPYEGPSELLEERDLASIAKYMKSEQCKKVFVMLGAGVSTAAGIPDFRSPGTGLYHNLQRLNLPYPEAVFQIDYFRENPLPFYTLARELYPGHFRPTLTHTFVKLLADHGLLEMCFTQNIDTLERQAGVPADRIVEAHGSFADQHCIDCGAAFDGARMRAAIMSGDIVKCEDSECGGLVKPDIVFFGESLPDLFSASVPKLQSAELLIVIGTSLKVHPFASLTGIVPQGCPRVLINMEPAGDIGARADDVVVLGRCDEVIRELAKELGWEEELEREWAKTEVLVPSETLGKAEKEKTTVSVVEKEKSEAEVAADQKPSEIVAREEAQDARVAAEVEALTERVAQALEISDETQSRTGTDLAESPGPHAQAPGQPEKLADKSGELLSTAELSPKEKEKL